MDFFDKLIVIEFFTAVIVLSLGLIRSSRMCCLFGSAYFLAGFLCVDPVFFKDTSASSYMIMLFFLWVAFVLLESAFGKKMREKLKKRKLREHKEMTGLDGIGLGLVLACVWIKEHYVKILVILAACFLLVGSVVIIVSLNNV